MDRITNKHLELELSRLNEMMQTPEDTFTDGVANVGNIHLYDNNIVQTKNTSHGIAILSYCKTKREAYEKIQAMSESIRLFRMARGI